MNIPQEYEAACKDALVKLLRRRPKASLGDVKAALPPKAWRLLLAVPFAELHVPLLPEPKTAKKTNGVSHPKAKDPDKVIDAYVERLSVGDELRTAELMKRTGLGRAAVLRRLVVNKRIQQHGRGCSAYFEVVE